MTELKEKHNLSGYRLHLARLSSIKSTAGFIKTHKYKLSLSKFDENELWNKFCKLAKVVDESDEGSIYDLLFKLYGLGFLFVKKATDKGALLVKIGEKYSSPIQKVIDSITDQGKRDSIKNVVVLESFLTQGASKSDKVTVELKNIFEKGLRIIFGEEDLEYKNPIESKNEILKYIFNKFEEMLKAKGSKISKDDRQSIFEDFFDVSFKDALEEVSKSEETFIVRRLPLKELKEATYLSKDQILLKILFPKAIELNKGEIQNLGKFMSVELLGISNGLSRFLSNTIKSFAESPDRVKNLILDSSPGVYDQDSEEINYISKTVHELCKKIPMAQEVDFIDSDYGRYRELIGGRLQGWLSNYFNRMKEWTDYFKAYLSDTEYKNLENNVPSKILEKIFVKVDNWRYEVKNKSHITKDYSIDDTKEYVNKMFTEKKPNKKEQASKQTSKKFELIQKKELGKIFELMESSNLSRMKIIEKNCSLFNMLFTKEQENEKEIFKQNWENIKELSEELYETTTNSKFDKDFVEMIEAYRYSLSEVNQLLNAFVESGISINSENKEIEIVKKGQQQKTLTWINESISRKSKKDSEVELDLDKRVYLSKDLRLRVPSFYPKFIGEAKAEAKTKLNEAWKNLIALSEEGQKFVDEVIKLSKKINQPKNWLKGNGIDSQSYSLLRKNLQSLYKIALNNNTKDIQKIIDFLKRFVRDDNYKKIQELDAGIIFYKSKFSRNKLSTIEIIEKQYKNFLDEFSEYFSTDNIQKFEHYYELSDKGATSKSIIKGEILKLYWAIKLQGIDREITNLNIEDFKHGKATKAGRFLNSTLTRAFVQKIAQSLYGGEIRGNLSLLSRNTFIERNVLQTINGEQTVIKYVPLTAIPGSVYLENYSKKKAQKRSLVNYERYIENLFKNETVDKSRQKYERIYKLILKKNDLRKAFMLEDNKSERKLKVDLYKNALNELRKELRLLNLSKLKTDDRIKHIQFIDKKTREIIRPEGNDTINFAFKIVRLYGRQDWEQVRSTLSMIPHRWEIVLMTKQELKQNEAEDRQGIYITKEGNIFDKGKLYKPTEKVRYSFPVLTKGHQLQFFENLLKEKPDLKYKSTSLGQSIILEREVEIKWKDGDTEIIPKKKKGASAFSLYVAIPWKFDKTEDSRKEIKKSDSKRLTQYQKEYEYNYNKTEKKYVELPSTFDKFLGIDLGEYGIGWAILPKQGNGKDYIASGFQEFPILKHLRENVKQWKLRQSTGIFSRPETKLARIREQAVGQIRNFIHNLALQYNAQPLYEDSVDAFEVGSNKIKKLYKSLKTSDIYSEVKADETVRKNIWGITNGIGKVIGSAMTSQVCRKCGKWAKELNEEEVYRGPDESNPAYGGQSQFICPHCKNRTNADEQAAMNICLKEYLKLQYKLGKIAEDFSNKESQLSTKELFLKKSPEYSLGDTNE